jgi:hypothetical protein
MTTRPALGIGPAPLSLLASVVAVAVLSACGGDRAGSGNTVSRSVVGDTLYVLNATPPEPHPVAFRLEEDLTIGVAEGEDEYMLTGVMSIAVDALGRIVVGYQWDRDVRVFGPDGRFLFRVGGAGQGPGEFYSNYYDLYDIRAWRDRITVQDLPRLNVYDGDGTFLRSFDTGLLTNRTRVPGSALGLQFWIRDPGRVAAVWRQFTPDGPTILRPFLADEELTGITWLDRIEQPSGFQRVGEGGGFSLPFTPNLEITLTGGTALVWGLSDAYQIHRYDAASDTWMVFSLEAAPRPVTSDEIDAFKQRFLEDSRLADWRSALERADYPSVHPFFEGLMGDDEGRVWVNVSVPAEPDEEPIHRYDLFDREGVYLGRVESPLALLAVGGDHAYARGSQEYPTVVRLRLIPPGQ